MVSTQVKVEELCRTCLTKEIDLISMYEVYCNSTLENIISTLTGIKIETGDGFPTTVCYVCKEKATNAYDFKLQSIQADTNLRKIFKKAKRDDKVCEVKYVKMEQDEPDDNFMDPDFEIEFSNDFESFDSIKTEPEAINDRKKADKKSISDKDGGTYCPLCTTSFLNTEGLTSHMWEHHADIMGPKKRGRPKRLGTTAILNKLSENGVHVKWVTDVKLSCTFCSQQLSSKDDLDSHVTSEHADLKLLNCLLCKKMFLKMEDFDKHKCMIEKKGEKQEERPDGDNTSNDICGEGTLQQIIEKVPDTECVSDIFICDYCGCVCAGREAIARHRDDEHPEMSPRCLLCCKTFASVAAAARHRTRCTHRERSLRCELCAARFAHAATLNKHILRSHRGQPVCFRPPPPPPNDREPAFRCDICSTKFCRKDLLARHAKVHKPSDKVFECNTCNKKFHRKCSLRTHMRVHESGGTGTSSCLCLYCGRGFSNSSNLIVHMRRHTGEKPYKCDFCGKGFPRSSDLQCHRRSHTGEKPCICGVCGKAFSRSNKLSRHMRVHTGVKPYKCVYCDKAFSQSNDLNLHVRRHTGDKPYVCELCGERFIQGTALHNHRRAHGHYSETVPPPAPPPYPIVPIHHTSTTL